MPKLWSKQIAQQLFMEGLPYISLFATLPTAEPLSFNYNPIVRKQNAC